MTSSSKPIEIDISHVLLCGMQNDSRFPEILEGLKYYLSQPVNRWDTCLHEAGHSIFFHRAGVTGLECLGPAIKYNTKTDKFAPLAASIKLGQIDTDLLNTKETILAIGKGFAAGSIVSREMTSQLDDGSETDFENMCIFMEMIHENHPNFATDLVKFWEAAKSCVTADLQHRLIQKDEIESEAKRIEPLIFKTHNPIISFDPPKFPSLL